MLVADFALTLAFELVFFFSLIGQFFLTLFVTVVGCCQGVLSLFVPTLTFRSYRSNGPRTLTTDAASSQN